MPLSADFVRKTADERFFEKVRLPTEQGCWPWLGGRTRDGYGSFWTGEWSSPRRPITVLAHRWVYERFVGPIPDGLYVCHHCDNPWCVYPKHLYVGTQADNVADRERRGRGAKTRRGQTTHEQREEMRRLYATGEYSLAALGRMFGVTYQTIKWHVTR